VLSLRCRRARLDELDAEAELEFSATVS
jgi:hypothetical protein